MSNKPHDQPPTYPAAVHQDAGPAYQSPGAAFNGYSDPQPQAQGYYPPGQPQYGPPPGPYYQQGYPQPQGYPQGYPPQGYYPQQRAGPGAPDDICAGFTAALALCCCADLCLCAF